MQYFKVLLKDYLASDVFRYYCYFSMLLLFWGLSYAPFTSELLGFEKSRVFFLPPFVTRAILKFSCECFINMPVHSAL